MNTMLLQDLVQDLKIAGNGGELTRQIRGIAYDSRKVEEGYLFVCVQGLKSDGHDFITQAVAKGAVALLVEKDPEQLGLPQELVNKLSWVQTDSTREGLALVSARFYGFPGYRLNMVGVTGTNGKTTITYLVEELLRAKGEKVGLIGTICNKIDDEILPVTNTTPLPLELQQLLAMFLDKGAGYCVMEVSSHALDLGRVTGIEFDLGVFTNLTQDHLDYHVTMENYRAAKAKLFSSLNPEGKKARPKYGIINIDDPAGPYMVEQCLGNVMTYGIGQTAQVRAEDVLVAATGVAFTAITPAGTARFQLQLTGLFNVYNSLAAICVGLAENMELGLIKKVLESVPGVAGRFETVNEGQQFGVIVDYAHTPDSLQNVLKTARELVQGRLITVFGCGGDRDKTKRPIMGNIAAQLSDFSVITSDNPRSEDPEAILNDVEAGVEEIVGKDKYLKIADRREAICKAIKMASPRDLVMIAGKGHETYQIIGNRTQPFDDREVARQCLREL